MIKNPFLKSISLTLFKKQQTTMLYQSAEVNKAVSTFTQEVEWEKEPYVKVYTGLDIQNLYKDLHPTSCKLVLYIQLNLQQNTDIIELSPELCMSFLNIESKTTFYKYLQDLVDNAIITKHKSSTFWINPALIFNGNRIEYYKQVCPECINVINITDIQESKTIRKKKDLMLHFNCSNYYQLKQLIGSSQIEDLLSKKLKLSEVKLLK